jgi:hypothetical protein
MGNKEPAAAFVGRFTKKAAPGTTSGAAYVVREEN